MALNRNYGRFVNKSWSAAARSDMNYEVRVYSKTGNYKDYSFLYRKALANFLKRVQKMKSFKYYHILEY